MRRLLLLSLLGLAACDAHAADFVQIEHGRQLAIIGDCAACHTVPGEQPLAGGRIVPTPFGAMAAPNLTPDPGTGLGDWSEADFAAALQNGIGKGGIHLYPAMPYPSYTRMTRQDVADLYAYLQTLKPVRHLVQTNLLPFPFNIRASMVVWNALYFSPGRFEPKKDKSPEWNRGAYLVEGPGHCGACHTPKNFLGGDKTSHALAGGALQGWFAADLDAGLTPLSEDDIVAYLKTGHNRTGFATGLMAEVVEHSTSKMDDADLHAIAVYLKDRPATASSSSHPQKLAADDPAMKRGAAIYVDECAACHKADGKGVKDIFPALDGNPLVQSANAIGLIHVVLHGTRNVATPEAPTAPAMPPFGWKLSDSRTAAVLTYIRNAWGNAAPAVSVSDVQAKRWETAGSGDQ